MSKQRGPTSNDLVAAALTALERPSPQHPIPGPPPPSAPLSPTLASLDNALRPKEKTVCEDCPNSVWFASPAEVKCYCRVMYLVTWSTREPQRLTECDGRFLGQD